jgi:carboxymethylenebutenolidase
MPTIDLSDQAATAGGSTQLRGYLATPPGDGPWPGVVMIHEIFGIDDVMRGMADRLAAMGYLTLAVDLFSAGGARRCLVTTMRAMLRGRGRAFADIEAARRWLLAAPAGNGKVGVVGFCMGGGFALLTATTGFNVAAVNYGHLPNNLDDAIDGACPIVASYGGRDRSLTGAAPKLESALSRAGVMHDVKEYPTAGHAFLNETDAGPRPLRPLFRVAGVRYDPVASADAWERIQNYLDTHLGAA